MTVDITTQSSQVTNATIECEIGDYIAIGMTRSSALDIKWNNESASTSSDCESFLALATNTHMYLMKASQKTNLLEVRGLSGTGSITKLSYYIFHAN